MDAIDFHLRGVDFKYQPGITAGQDEFPPLIVGKPLEAIGARPLRQRQIGLTVEGSQGRGRRFPNPAKQDQKNRQAAK